MDKLTEESSVGKGKRGGRGMGCGELGCRGEQERQHWLLRWEGEVRPNPAVWLWRLAGRVGEWGGSSSRAAGGPGQRSGPRSVGAGTQPGGRGRLVTISISNTFGNVCNSNKNFFLPFPFVLVMGDLKFFQGEPDIHVENCNLCNII